jgi:predicted unusual protein kinase regulating ubiquinone biosynthesis (AarF/ABC1/UbiB family)
MILEVNKSLWMYWDGVQNLFNMNMKFLQRELELCDGVIYKLIGYEYSENNISSDSILNNIDDYCRGEENIKEVINNLFSIEKFLKGHNLYVKFDIWNIVEDLINLYISLEESEKSLMKFLGTEDTSIVNDLEKIEKIIRKIFEFDCEFLEQHSLIAFIDNLLMFHNVEEIKVILQKTNDILN